MVLTIEDFIKTMPGSTRVNAVKYLDGLNAAIIRYDLSTPLRLAHFLAQVGHESGSLHYHEEIASGEKYEMRLSLGNTEKGDGVKFKGRGLIQITGRANYKAYGDSVGIDFIANPSLLGQTPHAVDSAGWFWNLKKLNALADKDDLLHITKRINGGTNGIADRKARLANAKKVLKAGAV